MIIFNLDGTLADCEHRRHFVDPSKNKDYVQAYADMNWYKTTVDMEFLEAAKKGELIKFNPNWPAFYEACNEDTAIWPVVRMIESLHLNEVTMKDKDIQIWSGRSESVRGKTEHWLKYVVGNNSYSQLKMRPIGNTEPDEVLKERWLDEHIASGGKPIDFVFDDSENCCNMWHRRGIFTFYVNQA